MKLKYKKMVLVVSMSTMFIGLVVFSIVSPSKNSSTEVEKKIETTKKPEKSEVEATQTPEPTKEPEENVLTKTADKEIVKLVDEYYNAGIKCSIEDLKAMHSNPELIDKKEVKAKYKYVDDVKNIECYTIKGTEKGSFLVYVYSEYRFKDIKTLAPGLSRLFLKKTEDGKFQIFNGADAKVSEFILETDKTKEVQTLVEKVSTKLDEALSNDGDLRKFNKDVLNKNVESSDSKDNKKEASEDDKDKKEKKTKKEEVSKKSTKKTSNKSKSE